MASQRRACQSGRAILETALVLSAFLAMLTALVDLAQLLFTHAALQERVRTAVRFGAASRSIDPAKVRNIVLYGRPDGAGTPDFHLMPDNVVMEKRAAGTEDQHLELRIVNYRYAAISPAMAGFRKAKPIVAAMPLSASSD